MNRSERFWGNVKGNPERGSGHRWSLTTIPTHKEMDMLEKHKVIFDVDPELREVIIELNNKRFKTMGSCAGHSNLRGGHGFIAIRGIPAKERLIIIKSILKKHGLQPKGIEDHPLASTKWFSTSFNPVGLGD